MPCLVPVRRLPTPSRSRHFGGVSEKKTRWDHVTRNALAALNNEAFEQGNGRRSFCTVLRVSLKTVDTGILLSAVFTLELEIDYPSETSLCTVAPSPTDTPDFFLGEGAVVHRLSEMESPSSNFPLKLTE